MTNRALQRVAFLSIVIVLPLFMALKIVEVHREMVIAGTTIGAGPTLLKGLARRLDDPSFWAVFACAFSAWLVMRSENAIGPQPQDQEGSLRLGYYLIWLLVSATCALVYILAVRHNHEAFFHPGHDHTIWTVQRIEGCANVLVLLFAPLFFAAGLAALNRTVRILAARTKDERARVSASALASAGIGPFISATLAFLLWQLIDFAGAKFSLWHAKPDVFGLASVGVDVLVLLLFCLPFLILFGLVFGRLRKCFRFKFHAWDAVPPPFDIILVIIGIGAIAAGGYYQANWRPNAECPTARGVPVIVAS